MVAERARILVEALACLPQQEFVENGVVGSRHVDSDRSGKRAVPIDTEQALRREKDALLCCARPLARIPCRQYPLAGDPSAMRIRVRRRKIVLWATISRGRPGLLGPDQSPRRRLPTNP